MILIKIKDKSSDQHKTKPTTKSGILTDAEFFHKTKLAIPRSEKQTFDVVIFEAVELRNSEKNSETVCPTVIDRLHQESNFGFPSGVDFGQINFDVTEADESGRWAYLVLNCHDCSCLVGEATIIRFCKLSGSFPNHLNLV